MTSYIYDMVDTWNNSATTFTSIKMNVTDTASDAASLLMDLQVGGTSFASISKGALLRAGAINIPSAAGQTGVRIAIGGGANGVYLGSTMSLSFSDATGATTGSIFGGSQDTFLTRRAAANLRLGAADAAAPVAQTLSVQSGTAGASALSCSISGTTLTVGGAVTGTIAIGHAVTGTGVSAGTVITAGSGTTWTVNNSQTVSSTTMYFNSVGQNLTITGSQGSGPSAGGSIVFQVAPAGSAATTAQNALVDALTINSARQIVSAIAGSASTPAYNFLSAGNGLYLSSNSLYFATSGGTVRFGFGTNGAELASTGVVGWSSSSTDASAAKDLLLFRDAANTLALRNGANAQAFRVYNTTDGTNSEFGSIDWTSNTNFLTIRTNKTGSGGSRGIIVQSADKIYFAPGGGPTSFRLENTGDLVCGADNTYDIGASGANRPRNIYAAGSYSGSGYVNGSGGYFYWNNRSTLSSPADGQILIANLAVTDFNRLQFGGTTSSFPALKRNSTALETKLADDSAYAPHAMQYLDVTDGITAPASATGRARIYVDTADGDLKVIFADGTVKTIVTDT